jgi:hypothetical protein
VKTPNN